MKRVTLRSHKNESGISDSEVLKLLVFGTIAISAVYLVGGWIYGVKEGRLERDREMRGRVTEKWNVAETHQIEERDYSLEFNR